MRSWASARGPAFGGRADSHHSLRHDRNMSDKSEAMVNRRLLSRSGQNSRRWRRKALEPIVVVAMAAYVHPLAHHLGELLLAEIELAGQRAFIAGYILTKQVIDDFLA